VLQRKRFVSWKFGICEFVCQIGRFQKRSF
jgi:hypothetical protein